MALYEFTEGEAKVGVSFHEIREHLSLTEERADDCSELLCRRGLVEWSTRGHVALTHLGLLKARHLRDEDPCDTPPRDDAPAVAIKVAHRSSGSRLQRALGDGAA
jgi:hypothetical protein